MKLDRLPYDPAALLDFFEEGLGALGALCERSWHDRLQLIAEGRAATLWNSDGALLETELHFPPADTNAPRHADREVFPGSPLTFGLAEAIRPSPLPLERLALQPFDAARPPSPDVAEKLWHGQFPHCTRWQAETAFQPAWHFSLVLLVRCEIHAIDQHWSLHRVALALPDGERDESLARSLDFAQAQDTVTETIPWPDISPAAWSPRLRAALAEECRADLEAIRARQERYLERELERIDDYFESYVAELDQRKTQSQTDARRSRLRDRIAATRQEHERRRHDQVQRHEIRVVSHLDALLLTAEPAWTTAVHCVHDRQPRHLSAYFLPRTRRWFVTEDAPGL